MELIIVTEMCEQVEEQRKDNADKLGPLKQQLLRWLKTKLTYHINLSDDDQDDPIISKGNKLIMSIMHIFTSLTTTCKYNIITVTSVSSSANLSSSCTRGQINDPHLIPA